MSPPKSSTIHIADFEDGDVEIRLSEDSSCVRRLHKFILTRHSPYFKASLSEAWSSPSEKLIYVLEPDEEGETWMLVRQKRGVPTASALDLRGNLKKGSSESDSSTDDEQIKAIEAHDFLFRAFYQYQMGFSGDVSVFREQMENVLQIADMYLCSDLITGHIVVHAHQCMEAITAAYENDPTTVLAIAQRTKCDWMFKEAMAYLITLNKNRFHAMLDDIRKLGIADLVTRKRTMFRLKLYEVDRQLMTFATELDASKESYIAAAFFQRQIANRLKSGEGAALGDNYEALYVDMLLRQGWSPADFDVFKKSIGAAQVATVLQSTSFKIILSRAAKIVRPLFTANSLMGNSSHLVPADAVDKDEKPMRLLYMRLADNELPWYQAKDDTAQMAMALDI